MLTTTSYLATRRVWVIESFSVWGTVGSGAIDYLALEKVGATLSIHYGSADLGGSEQEVLYSSLIDSRGNALPQLLNSPKVIISPRDERQSFVVGTESNDRFKIARHSEESAPAVVDLLIMETDL